MRPSLVPGRLPPIGREVHDASEKQIVTVTAACFREFAGYVARDWSGAIRLLFPSTLVLVYHRKRRAAHWVQ